MTDATFAKTVLEAPRPVLVDFGAEWCGPCVAVAPVIRSLALEYADRLTVATVDVDADPQLAARYGVRSLPTVMLLEEGADPARARRRAFRAGISRGDRRRAALTYVRGRRMAAST